MGTANTLCLFFSRCGIKVPASPYCVHQALQVVSKDDKQEVKVAVFS